MMSSGGSPLVCGEGATGLPPTSLQLTLAMDRVGSPDFSEPISVWSARSQSETQVAQDGKASRGWSALREIH